MGAVALLIPNEVKSTPPVSSLTLSSFSDAVAAIATAPDDESTMAREPRALATRRRRRRHRDETQAVAPPYGFAVDWLGSSQNPLRSIDVQFNTGLIYVLDFSPDGSFLVSGVADKCVRLWNIGEILRGNVDSRPMQMERQHGDGGVYCVAVSPNNRSIFSGGTKDTTVTVYL